MKTKTVGEMLKEERLRSRLTLSELATKTKIRLAYLKSLEENRFEDLPSATFVKGYIRTYAKFFGLDHRPLLALLRRDYGQSAKGRLVLREFIKPMMADRWQWSGVTLIALLAAGSFLSLLIYVGVQWYNLNKPPELVVTAPEDRSLVAAQVKVEGRTHPEATLTVNLAPVALRPDGSFTTEVFLSREGATTITVEATDRRGRTSLEQRTVVVEF